MNSRVIAERILVEATEACAKSVGMYDPKGNSKATAHIVCAFREAIHSTIPILEFCEVVDAAFLHTGFSCPQSPIEKVLRDSVMALRKKLGVTDGK